MAVPRRRSNEAHQDPARRLGDRGPQRRRADRLLVGLHRRRIRRRLAHDREARRRRDPVDPDQQPVHLHRLGHVARIRPDDLRAPRDREPRGEERDDPVARLQGRVERRLHAAHRHSARRREVERRQAVHRRRHRLHVHDDQEHPRARPRRPQARRCQEGRRERGALVQRVEVREAGRRAAGHHRPRAPVEGDLRPLQGPGQGRGRHRPVHDQELLLAGRGAEGPHRLLGRQGAGGTAQVPRVQRQHRTPPRAAEQGGRLGADLHHRLPEELRRQGSEAQRVLGRERAEPGHGAREHHEGAVQRRRLPQGRQHGRRPQGARREGAQQRRPRAHQRHRHSAAHRRPVHRPGVQGQDVLRRRRRRQEGAHRRGLHLEGRCADRSVRQPRLVHAAGSAGLERLRHRHPARGHADQEHPRRGRQGGHARRRHLVHEHGDRELRRGAALVGLRLQPVAHLRRRDERRLPGAGRRRQGLRQLRPVQQPGGDRAAQAVRPGVGRRDPHRGAQQDPEDLRRGRPGHPDRHPPAAGRVQHPHLHRVAEREGPVRDGGPHAALGGPGDHEPEAGRQVTAHPSRSLSERTAFRLGRAARGLAQRPLPEHAPHERHPSLRARLLRRVRRGSARAGGEERHDRHPAR
ncbi:hypothetical protein MICRO8M_130260 [Microbacterium sp. 8M]|nr:hypothetical protein MICRO8M_130260 [Microbacterium sp. 8M]